MSSHPGPPPDERDGEQPTLARSKSWQTPGARTSPPSLTEYVAHNASQAALHAAQWGSDPNRLLRPEEAAEFLSLSRARIYELLKAGEIESVTIGRSRRIPLAALDDFVTRLRAEGGCHTPRAS